MKKSSDNNVKKTLVRDCEKRLDSGTRNTVSREVGCSRIPVPSNSQDLNAPSLCSSEALTKYLTDVKGTARPPKEPDLNVDRDKINAKITKKLNFKFNDKIYRNLIELNNSYEINKKSRDKKSSSLSSKKDLEPKIEDFYEETVDNDSIPTIPVIKTKFKMVRKVENGQLHKIISAYENL